MHIFRLICGLVDVIAGCAIFAAVIWIGLPSNSVSGGPIAIVSGADGPTSIYVAGDSGSIAIPCIIAFLLLSSGILLLKWHCTKIDRI